MATNPVLEQIAGEILDALAEITVANGYQNDVGTILRPTRVGLTDGAALKSIGHLSVMLDQDSVSRVLSVEGNGSAVEWIANWNLFGFILPADNDATPIDTLANRFVGDIEKAVMQDPQRHDLAINTEVLGNVPFVFEDGQFGGRVLRIAVTFRTLESDPFVSRSA